MLKIRSLFINSLIIIAVVLCVILAGNDVFERSMSVNADASGYYTYTVADDEATITDCDTSISGEIIIPSTLDGYSVTSIGAGAFSECSGITTITIPNSVTSIGQYAFSGCSGLASITIGDNVTIIDSNAFYNCSSLASVIIPNSVESIGSFAFWNCSNLTSVTIGSSVATIDIYAFHKCSNLEEINVSIANATYSSVDGVLYNKAKTELVCCPGGKEGSFIVSDNVTSIGYRAFYDCSGLTSVIVPNSVTSIGQYAFYGCSGLTSITIPFVGNTLNGTSNTNFGYIFGGVGTTNGTYVPESLKEVIITGGTSIGSSAFENCTKLTSIVLPNSVESFGAHAFYNCKRLTSITIPDSVTSIGYYAFELCSGLTSVTMGTGVTSIGMNAFLDCTGLKSVYITDIGAWCGISFGTLDSNPLYYAEELYINGTLITDLVIPDSVTSIGWGAFYGNYGLESITIPFVGNTLNGMSNAWFGYIFGASGYTVNASYVPTSLKEVTVTGGTRIVAYAFMNCSGLTRVTIGNGIVDIESSVFSGCSGLKSVTISNSVEHISDYVFKGCSGLTSVSIPNSVTYISNGVFNGCSGLTSVIIPSSVTRIRSYAFSGCSGLTSITIPSSVTSIDANAFSDANAEMTIFSTSGSYAEIYALENGYKFEEIKVTNDVLSLVGGAESIVMDIGDDYDVLFEGYSDNTTELITLTANNSNVVIDGLNIYATRIGNTVITATATNGATCEFIVNIVMPDVASGDVDNDGTVTVADALVAINVILNYSEANALHKITADADKDGKVDILDIMYLLNMI